MGLKTRLALAISLFFTLIMFQNCGGFESQSQDPSTGDNGQLESDVAFSAGQEYAPRLVPFQLEDRAFLTALLTYENRQGYKAIAFNEDGAGYISSTNNPLVANQQEWSQTILERCHLSTGKPCSLFAEGNLIAQDEEDFFAGFVSVIQNPAGDFNPLEVPGVLEFWRNHQAADYPMYEPNQVKAYALGANGNSAIGWSDGNQDEANRRAIEYCEALNEDRGCILFAENQTVLFDINTLAFPENSIQYAPGTLDFDRIPFVPNGAVAQIKLEGEASLNTGGHFVLAISRFGRASWQASPTPISLMQINQTLADCKAQLPAPDPAASNQDPSCVLYSIDNEIRMTRRALEAAFY